ncbi:Hypothetical_protein [Hexamita inflata]|uniref:Hypothetical_protein n=1 Tax=Hexamita inflata TaxID=28002 RepID=A0AA86QLC3_9EUKA|nr:Hypothetical protein HINF_LOCUS43522 [Hexamita inflata]CAI9955879.1 Hypothetical protein HINF_LOCUS43524 [Hexamita inflata]
MQYSAIIFAVFTYKSNEVKRSIHSVTLEVKLALLTFPSCVFKIINIAEDYADTILFIHKNATSYDGDEFGISCYIVLLGVVLQCSSNTETTQTSGLCILFHVNYLYMQKFKIRAVSMVYNVRYWPVITNSLHQINLQSI